MKLHQLLRMVYDMGKSEGIEIGRQQVLEEDLIRLTKQYANIERDLIYGHELLPKE